MRSRREGDKKGRELGTHELGTFSDEQTTEVGADSVGLDFRCQHSNNNLLGIRNDIHPVQEINVT